MKRCLFSLFALSLLLVLSLSAQQAHAWCTSDTLRCGAVIDSSNAAGHTDVNRYNCTGSTNYNGKAHVHWLNHPGGELNITLDWSDSHADRGLRLFLLGSCDQNDCITSDPHQIHINNLAAGIYFLVIDGLTNNTISYHLEVHCTPSPCHIQSGTYCTFTQGGWGQNSCSGGNVACRRDTWFDTVYPGSLVVGGTFTITLDASSNVAAFLPTGGAPGVLAVNRVNPTTNGTTGTFAGQVISLRLNRDFAAAGAFGPNHDIGHLMKNSAPLQGWTVNQILALAEAVLGGNTSLLAPNGLANVSALSTICDNINNTFDNCANHGNQLDYLVEPDCFGPPPPTTGRCCYGDPYAPQCAVNTEAECNNLNGTWLANATCQTAQCVPLIHTGRCCYGNPYEPQCTVNTQSACTELGGQWAQDQTCITLPCVPRIHTGRCCYGNPYEPQCTVNTQAACNELGGSWVQDANCETAHCVPLIHTGRCCYGDPYEPSCTVNTQAACNELAGEWVQDQTCNTLPCVPRIHTGRCCYGDPYEPSCIVTTAQICEQLGGGNNWAQDETCETAPCVPLLHTGRCCYGDPYDPSCTVNTEAACRELGGSWSINETCDTSPCVPLIHRGRCCYINDGVGACVTNTQEECALLGGIWDITTTCELSECDEWLPVEFGSFDAVGADQAVILNWSTISETDVVSYTIERAENNAWTAIGSIPSMGNSSSGHNYSYRDETVTNGETYTYRLSARNLNGTVEYNGEFVSATPGHSEVVTGFTLEQNYPNPFNPSTTIKFDIAEAGFVKLAVYDLSGRMIQVLVNGELSPNSYSVHFNGAGLASGVYFYRLEMQNIIATKKLMLMK